MTSSRPRDGRSDEEILAGIVEEIVDRKRNTEQPEVEEYVSRYPHLAERIESHFRTMELLEGFREAGLSEGVVPSDPGDRLGEAISLLSPLLQRVIFLKHFEKRDWQEIARIVGESKDSVRRKYSSAIKTLMSRCSGSP